MSPNDALTPAPSGALTFEDRVKQLLRILAQKLSEDLGPQQLAMTYNAISSWTKNLTELHDNAKKRLVKTLVEKGAQVSDAGTMKLTVDGWELEARPAGRIWDETRVMALLRGKQLPLDKWMRPTVKYAVDEKQLAVLQELGKLTAAEINACKLERGYALQPPRPAGLELPPDEETS